MRKRYHLSTYNIGRLLRRSGGRATRFCWKLGRLISRFACWLKVANKRKEWGRQTTVDEMVTASHITHDNGRLLGRGWRRATRFRRKRGRLISWFASWLKAAQEKGEVARQQSMRKVLVF